MSTLLERFLLRLRLLLLCLLVGSASSLFAVALVWTWVTGLGAVTVLLSVAWLVATFPWLVIAAGVAADLVFLVVAKGAVFVPTMNRIARAVDREREITKRPQPKLDWFTKAGFYTNPLMPLTVATATFLEGQPALEPLVDSFHDTIMRAPRKAPVIRITTDWHDHRIRGATA